MPNATLQGIHPSFLDLNVDDRERSQDGERKAEERGNLPHFKAK